MRLPSYMPDNEYLIEELCDIGDDDIAPDAVAISAEDYLRPQSIHNPASPEMSQV